MLDYEFTQLVNRLGPQRGKDTRFFAFCNTVKVKGYRDNGPVRTCVLIRYPEDLPGNRAVIIDQLLHSGWMSDATRRLLPANN